MPKLFSMLALAVLLAGGLTGCDAQRWVSTIQAPAAAAKSSSHVWPSFSQSGRIEAKLLTQVGPMPLSR